MKSPTAPTYEGCLLAAQVGNHMRGDMRDGQKKPLRGRKVLKLLLGKLLQMQQCSMDYH